MGEFLVDIKKEVWKGRQENSQSSRTEEDRTGEENNKGVYPRIQKNSKRK